MKLLERNLHREIIPITSKDCFIILDRMHRNFDFPIHFHPEYELNLIYNGQGVKRIVGDHVAEMDDIELVFLGPNLFHGWIHQGEDKDIHEIMIHFHNDLLEEKLLSRTLMKPIHDLFKNATYGILFSKDTAREVYPRIQAISKLHGLDYLFSLISLLNDLACSKGQKILSHYPPVKQDFYNSGNIKIVHDYIQKNFSKKIKVKDLAAMLSMTEVSFSRLIKKRTGKTFIEYLNDVRIGFACQWLLEKDTSIAEIAYNCGFNTISYFNRIFKQKKGCTPTEYKKDFEEIKPS